MAKKMFEVEIRNNGPKGYETAVSLRMPATWSEFHDALQKARIKDGRSCGNELLYQAAEALIQKAGEQKLLEALTDWESRHNYAKDSARTVRHKALQLHISRIFDNPRWVNFIPFNREYRPEVLEHASLVTVINECCGKPGEVTQEQIDGACTGTVACPHCGRWSSFSIVEPKQAEEQGMEMI